MLKEYRIKKNISLERLVFLTKLDIKTILKIENNLIIPSVDTFGKIVIALEMTNEEIVKEIIKISFCSKIDELLKKLDDMDKQVEEQKKDIVIIQNRYFGEDY